GRVDARADLYSLGGTLYHTLAGRPPFQGTGVALVTKHLREKPRSPREAVPDLPRSFEALVLRLLEKDPAARGGDAESVARELDAIARSKDGETGSLALTRRSPFVLALVLVLAGLGAAAFVFLRDGAPPLPRDPDKPRPVEQPIDKPKPPA